MGVQTNRSGPEGCSTSQGTPPAASSAWRESGHQLSLSFPCVITAVRCLKTGRRSQQLDGDGDLVDAVADMGVTVPAAVAFGWGLLPIWEDDFARLSQRLCMRHDTTTNRRMPHTSPSSSQTSHMWSLIERDDPAAVQAAGCLVHQSPAWLQSQSPTSCQSHVTNVHQRATDLNY